MQPFLVFLRYDVEFFKNILIMNDKLIVVKPFNSLNKGDVFTFSDGRYICSTEQISDGTCVKDNLDYSMSTKSTVILSKYTADALVDMGYLSAPKAENNSDKKDRDSVFKEMDNLLSKYYDRISNIDEEFEDAPTCLKNEAEVTTLNLIKVLKHLKEFENA